MLWKCTEKCSLLLWELPKVRTVKTLINPLVVKRHSGLCVSYFNLAIESKRYEKLEGKFLEEVLKSSLVGFAPAVIHLLILLVTHLKTLLDTLSKQREQGPNAIYLYYLCLTYLGKTDFLDAVVENPVI